MTVEIFGSISNKKKNFADVSFSSLEKGDTNLKSKQVASSFKRKVTYI